MLVHLGEEVLQDEEGHLGVELIAIGLLQIALEIVVVGDRLVVFGLEQTAPVVRHAVRVLDVAQREQLDDDARIDVEALEAVTRLERLDELVHLAACLEAVEVGRGRVVVLDLVEIAVAFGEQAEHAIVDLDVVAELIERAIEVALLGSL